MFETNIINLYGQLGNDWLNKLPDIAKELQSYWQLEELIAVPNMSYHYVAKSSQNGLPVVLKIGFDGEGVAQEAKALRFYDGRGCIKLYDVNDPSLKGEAWSFKLQDLVDQTKPL